MKYYTTIFSILFLLPLFVFAQSSLFSKDLSFGIQGDSEVIKLQEFLTDQEIYSGPITGNFFSLTLKAVKTFQAREGVSPAAGYFGPLTRAKANSILSFSITASDQQAVSETGSLPQQQPTPKATNNITNSLQTQIIALLQQINALQQQLQVQQQVQQGLIDSAKQTITKPVESTPVSPMVQSLQISLVSVLPDRSSAKVEWQTNEPTESKIFVSGGSLSSKIFKSISGLSTRHSTTITGLLEETDYSYEIEAITGDMTAVKKQGNFRTLPPPPLFEFQPVVRVGNSTTGINPVTGTNAGDVGLVYISVNEAFDHCELFLGDAVTGTPYFPGHITEWRYGGTPVRPGQIVIYSGFPSETTQNYKFTCGEKEFTDKTVTGSFTMPSSQIYTEKRIKPWPEQPNLHGEFMFWHYGISESLLNLKIRVTLNNHKFPNELIFYKSGVSNLWQKFSDISDGDILEINLFPSNYQLIWSFSNSPGDLSLKIIEGSASNNRMPVLFKFTE